MSARYIFNLKSEEHRRPLPGKIIISQQPTETENEVMLKLLGYLLFYRDRIQIQAREHLEMLPFLPDLVQLDYEMRVSLWVECGDCSLTRLDKLAVKVPEAEIWVLTKTEEEANELQRGMAKENLRTDRYGIIGFNQEMFTELLHLLKQRNEITWFGGSFEPPAMQFEFNGLWFDSPFLLLSH